MAVHKRLGGVQKKKRLSLLKRIILRERASKAVEAATATLEAARAHVEQAAVTQGSIQAQLQVRCVPLLGNCLTVQGSLPSGPAAGALCVTGQLFHCARQPGGKPHVLSQLEIVHPCPDARHPMDPVCMAAAVYLLIVVSLAICCHTHGMRTLLTYAICTCG